MPSYPIQDIFQTGTLLNVNSKDRRKLLHGWSHRHARGFEGLREHKTVGWLQQPVITYSNAFIPGHFQQVMTLPMTTARTPQQAIFLTNRIAPTGKLTRLTNALCSMDATAPETRRWIFLKLRRVTVHKNAMTASCYCVYKKTASKPTQTGPLLHDR